MKEKRPRQVLGWERALPWPEPISPAGSLKPARVNKAFSAPAPRLVAGLRVSGQGTDHSASATVSACAVVLTLRQPY
jgi:hypothetical protein